MSNGIIKKNSQLSFTDTYNTIRNTIENNPNLKIIAEINHGNNASNVGKELQDTALILFGNPNLGTPLMQNSITAALDLPQKIVVSQEDENVVIYYNDPIYLMERHAISGLNEIINTIGKALDNITSVASS